MNFIVPGKAHSRLLPVKTAVASDAQQFRFKLLRIMKLTAFFLLVATLHIGATGFSQKVSISGKDLPLNTVFEMIEKQTGYAFVYDRALLKEVKPVTLDLKAASLEEVLAKCLQGQPYRYDIDDAIITISPQPLTPAKPVIITIPSVEIPNMDIKGRVVDSTGEPLVSTAIIIKGTKNGTQTDGSGNFVLKNTEQNLILVISHTGYLTREVTFKPGENMTIVLHANNNPLDAVNIVAYGTNTRRFTVGSVAVVTAKDIERQPVMNPLMALQGQVAGLNVTPTVGAPGATVQIQIRGQNTLRTGNLNNPSLPNPYDQPLFLVDGVPFAPQNNKINQMASLAASIYNNSFAGMSGFNSINPADIESITVLKDADATSIYGSQGANGVVLITTKKGKPGKTVLNLNVNTGPNSVTRPIKMLNTQQYVALRREALHNNGQDYWLTDPTYSQYIPELTVFDTTRYTDWYHQFFNRNPYNVDAHASISGGNLNSTFIVSTGYSRTAYNFPGNFYDSRLSLHTGFHHNSVDRKFTLDFGTDFAYDHNQGSISAYSTSILTIAPDAPQLLDSMGNLIWHYKGADLAAYQKFSFIKQPDVLNTYNLNSTMKLAYQLAPGLKISSMLGLSRVNVDEYGATPLSAIEPGSYTTSSARFGINSFETINIEPQIDYQHPFGNGVLSVLAGGTYKKNFSNSSLVTGNNYTNDALLHSIAGAATSSVTDGYNVYKYAAAYGRIGYVYDQKYIINLTGRRDGSSNFAPGRQFGDFGSAGAGWIFSEEKGFDKALPFMSYAKIYGNYGTNGSDGIAPYMYQANWKPVQYVNTFEGSRPYSPVNLYNQDYSWDVKKTINIGLDLGFFHDRLLVNATWYRSRIGNQLISYPLPGQTGFASVVQNFQATIQNSGWEFTINSTNIKTKDFSWTSNFNISTNKNKLVAFPGLTTSSYASYYTVGKPVTVVNGFKYKGVNDTTGLFEFYTAKGLPTNTPNGKLVSQGGDMQPILDPAPKFFGGLGNNFSYKGLTLGLFFQFSKQLGYNYKYAVYSNGAPGGSLNVPVLALDHWRQPGDKSEFPKVGTGPNTAAFTFSDGAYSDASYIRLKTLSLSYALPAPFLKRAYIKGCNAFVNVQNLFTITDYKVGDPEMPGRLYAIPLQRVVAGGLNFNF